MLETDSHAVRGGVGASDLRGLKNSLRAFRFAADVLAVRAYPGLSGSGFAETIGLKPLSCEYFEFVQGAVQKGVGIWHRNPLAAGFKTRI